jgi:BioD-like phosphotransacetylase family protein
MLKPIYMVGTQRDVGKTTLSIGLVHALRQRGLRVAYTKPVGQRTSNVEGQTMHDDERVISRVLGPGQQSHEMVLPILSGTVEKGIYDYQPDQLLKKVATAFDQLRKDHDAIIVEAMGHVAMGSVMGMSAADIARSIGARALLVSGGGIGKAIDEISLCSTFIKSRGADLMGVVINKVWPEKYDRVKDATTRALTNLGMTSLGTVPYETQLVSPTMRQVYDKIGGEIITAQDRMDLRVHNTIVAAMQAEHMTRYIVPGTLIITPGDRRDNIIASLHDERLGMVSGLILTGGFEFDADLRHLIYAGKIPVIAVPEDTYAIASKLRETIFKITPDDNERIAFAMQLAARYVDVDKLISLLE